MPQKVIGNRFWKERFKHGRDKTFKTPTLMWDAACAYFEYVEDNPLLESKAFNVNGAIEDHDTPKMRAMTIEGLCIFMGVNTKYMTQFRNGLDQDTEIGQEYSNIITNIYDVIRNQKFEGAAAGLLNANIIARDLGLVEKQEVKGEVDINTMSKESVQDEIKKLLDARDSAKS